MEGCVEVRPVVSRPKLSRRQGHGRWLIASGAAALLHLAVLATVMIVPVGRVAEDDAAQPEVVSLVMEPEALEPPAEAVPVAEAPPPPAEAPQTAPLPVPDNPPELAPPPGPVPEPAPVVRPREAAPPPRPARREPVSRPAAVPARPSEAAPAQPSKAVATDVLEPYRNSLSAYVKAYQRYPPLALARQQEGLVMVRVTIRRDGGLVAASVERGSGWEALDRAALAALKRADPLPAVPVGLPGSTMELTFPVVFHLEQ